MDKTTKQNIKYYDAEATAYDENRYITPRGQALEALQKGVIANYLEELEPNANVLELGCGTGRFLPFMSRRGYRMTGIDISEGMLRQARLRLEAEGDGTTRVMTGNACALDFDDGSFDAVISILVVNLIPDYRKAFGEVARILQPGAIFVLSVPNLSSIYFPAGLYVNLRKRTTTSNQAGFRYSHWFSRYEILRSLRQAGFSIEQVKGQPPFLSAQSQENPLSTPIIRWLLAKSVYIKARRI